MNLNNDHYKDPKIPNTPYTLSEPVIFSKLFLFGNEFTNISLDNDESQSLEGDFDDPFTRKNKLKGIQSITDHHHHDTISIFL